MPLTYQAIASVTVGSGGASSIDFTSIPSTFTDLVVKLSARTNRADNSDGIVCRPNNSSANGSQRYIYGTGSGAASGSDSSVVIGAATAANDTSNTFGNSEAYITNYNSTTTFKSISSDGVNENNATVAYQVLRATLWSDNSAITSLVLLPQVGSAFVQYSTATLYGIKNS